MPKTFRQTLSRRWCRGHASFATWLLVPTTLFTGACASASASKASTEMGGSSVQTAVLSNASGSARGMNMVSITEVNRTLVAAPPERAFQALSAAYAALNIPVTDINQQARTIGNSAFRTRRRVGDVPTLRALDCGGDSGMPNAETYQLTLTIQSKVVPSDAGGSVILTTLEGTGRNPTTAASNEVRCASLGALEKRIGELVRKTLTGG
ncbi:hypothetical protein [Gemmatimonas sp.]|jgi:hypothetical protein|uniref:hypothetical protein n=1 Tax=Gemmatimonas sp. TaxID=1962908 RepID=UPI0037C09A3F